MANRTTNSKFELRAARRIDARAVDEDGIIDRTQSGQQGSLACKSLKLDRWGGQDGRFGLRIAKAVQSHAFSYAK